MDIWEKNFDDELERIGYRVRWEANRSYTVLAPGGKYLSSENSLANARTAAYNHWQKSNSPVEKLSQEIHRLHQELDARQAEMDRLRHECDAAYEKRIALRKALIPFKYAAARDGNVLLASDEDALYIRTAQGNFVPVYGIIGGLQIKDLRAADATLIADESEA